MSMGVRPDSEKLFELSTETKFNLCDLSALESPGYSSKIDSRPRGLIEWLSLTSRQLASDYMSCPGKGHGEGC